MIALIFLICPSVVSVWWFESLTRKSLSRKAWVYRFSLNLLLINGACFWAKDLIFHTAGNPLCSAGTDMLPIVAAHYLVMALVFAALCALVEAFLCKNVKLTVEEKEDE